MRLAGGSSYNEGIVEVYYNGKWGSVCYYGWDELAANIVCKQLGYKFAELVNFGTRPQPDILLENIICSNNDTILASCGHYGVGINVKCNHHSYNAVAAVKCHGMYFNNFMILIICVHLRCGYVTRTYARYVVMTAQTCMFIYLLLYAVLNSLIIMIFGLLRMCRTAVISLNYDNFIVV